MSIYMIAAAAGFVLLGALLIDFSRIAAFRHVSNLAVQSGVRSVLSSFDPGFYERYGLFIRGGDVGDELFQQSLENYFAEADSRIFAYLDAEWLEAGVLESRPLADHDVFKRQVLEEMKYKAPIDLALELGERFQGLAPKLEEAAQTVEVLERMQQAYDRREAELDRVLEAQVQWGQAATAQLQKLVPELSQAASQYSSYMSQKQALANLGPDVDPLAVQATLMAISAYESRVARLASALSAEARKVESEAARRAAETGEALQKARTINEEMKRIAEEAARNAASQAPLDTGTGDQASAELAEIRDSIWELVLDQSFFTDYANELELQMKRSHELIQEADRASAAISNLGSASETSLKNAASSFDGIVTQFSASYGPSGSIIKARRDKLQQHRSHDSERKALEKQAKEEWGGWRSLTGSLRNMQGLAEEKAEFQKVHRLAKENLKWNKEAEMQTEQTDINNPSMGRDAALEQTGRVLGALEDGLIGKRDDLYFAEYAHSRFSRFSPSDVKKMINGENISLALDHQEAEYILYGFANPASNLSAAYSEIFAFRLAIRTLEGLIECRSLGHPLLVLAGALVYGIKNAVQDIYALLSDDAVPLSKYWNVETRYADYLRLFYLLRGADSARLSRFIAVMEHQTGLALTRAYTYTSGEGIASIRLWFLPGLMKVLNRTADFGGTVKGNRYEAEFRADSSYQ